MKSTDNFEKFCYPVPGFNYDIIKLYSSVKELLLKLNIDEDYFTKRLSLHNPVMTCNITHIKGITGQDRWDKYKESHSILKEQGISEEDFTETLSELDNLYVKEIIDAVFDNHQKIFNRKFQGRCQLIWSQPRFGYSLHRDYHTKHRYHIPIYTDPEFFWLFDNNSDYHLVHMPADGRVWYLNPKDIKHTIMHLGRENRLHILLTSTR